MFSFVSSVKLRSYCYLIHFEPVKGFSPNKSGYIIETSLKGGLIFVNFSSLSEEHIECISSFFKINSTACQCCLIRQNLSSAL